MDGLRWTLLGSHYVVTNNWFTLRADAYRLPDGQTIEPVHVLEYRPWVNVIALTPEGEAVLVRQYRPGLDCAVLEVPGGMADHEDSSMLEAVRRELLEETGYGGGEFVETGVAAPNPATHTNMMHCFLARDVVPMAAPRPDATEHLEVVLAPLEELVDLAKRGELTGALHVACLFFALAHLGRIG